MGATLAKVEETFVAESAGYDETFLATAFIEVAVVVDVTKKVREATYILEGDGPIAVIVVEVLDSIERYYKSTYADMDYPNVRRHIANAVAMGALPPGFVPPAPAVVQVENLLRTQEEEQLANMAEPDAAVGVDASLLEAALKCYCLKISNPFMNYFDEKVMDHNRLPFWRAASLADPLNMQRETITTRYLRTTIAPLMSKLVTPALVDKMVSELSEYEKACNNLNWKNDSYEDRLPKVEKFWASHKLLPGWTEYAHLVFLLQPTSACVELSFSILKYIMGDQQVNSLRDKIEASLKFRYNRGLKTVSYAVKTKNRKLGSLFISENFRYRTLRHQNQET